MKRAFAAVLLALPFVASAGMSFRIPAPGAEPMPNYWSGTNCRASVHVHPTPGSSAIVRLRILIGGATAYDVNRGYDELANPGNWNVYLMFDSTHFGNGFNIGIVAEAWDELGYMYSSTLQLGARSAQVKNKAIAFNHPGITSDPSGGGNGAIAAKAAIDSVGTIATVDDATSLWTPSTWFSNMTGANIAYVGSHGNPSVHEAGDATPVFPWDVIQGGNWVPGYEQQRMAHIGSGSPPFNSTGNPALNLLYIHACNCGDTNNFIRGCWPYQNGYGQWLENQALVAFTVFVLIRDFNSQTSYFMNWLAQGWTLYAARLNTIANSEELGFEVQDVSGVGTRFLTSGDMAIYGDAAMRLTSVYTGSNVAPIGWSRLSTYPYPF